MVELTERRRRRARRYQSDQMADAVPAVETVVTADPVQQRAEQLSPAPSPPPARVEPAAPPPTLAEAVQEAATKPLTKEEQDAKDMFEAQMRAQQLIEADDGTAEGGDKYAIPPDIVPAGWSYQWKVFTVLGQENPGYQVQLARSGWTTVPASRHPEMMPIGWTGQYIERDGQVLMQIPKVIEERQRILERRRALDQVRTKEAQLTGAPPGTFQRGTHPGAPVSVGKGYAPMQVPGDMKA